MSHSAGFSYGGGNTVVDAMYKEAKLFDSASLQEMIDKLAKIPLNYQPGKGWTYSVSMDIEGYLVEKLSGQKLPDFMRDHIFTPLGMRDAGFFVPQEKRSRFATKLPGGGRQTCSHRRHGVGQQLLGATNASLRRRRLGFDRRGLLSLRTDAWVMMGNSRASVFFHQLQSS